MTSSLIQMNIDSLKQQARRLRQDLEKDGHAINHSKSLELLAHQFGLKDWNTLVAILKKKSQIGNLAIEQTVKGYYLGNYFTGNLKRIQKLTNGRYRITLVFEKPIDVVKFNSFSNIRKSVTCIVNQNGQTYEKTSNGEPHLKLQLN